MPRTLGTAISDEDDLILHRASDLLDALPWQRVRNLHTPRREWMVGQPEAIGALPGKKFPLKLVKNRHFTNHGPIRGFEFPWACGPPMEMKAAFPRPIDSKRVMGTTVDGE
jgi:hypothetical protein